MLLKIYLPVCFTVNNRVGGAREDSDLPHHRAYRSVHGGSIVNAMHRLVPVEDTVVSRLYESFV